jgi:hypothetical protein
MSKKEPAAPSAIEGIVERLKYAASRAGSIGMGEYTRVHKKDLASLIDAFENNQPTGQVANAEDLQKRLNRVKHFLTPESASKVELQEAVDLATNVLAVGAARGVKPDLS